jgi:hypothetical protein
MTSEKPTPTPDEELDIYAFPYLADEEYTKAIGQFRMKVYALLDFFDQYGLGIGIDPIAKQIVRMAEEFGMVVRGEDRPIGANITTIPKQINEK